MQHELISGDNHIDLTYCPTDLWSSQAPAKWKKNAPRVRTTSVTYRAIRSNAGVQNQRASYGPSWACPPTASPRQPKRLPSADVPASAPAKTQ